MTVKRAHMVSKGYLRAWADSEDHVDVLDLQSGRGDRIKIDHATVVNHAYRTNLLQRDLEREYWAVENAGIPALVRLRGNDGSLAEADRDAVIAFLDMHLDRGRYADQARRNVPAVILKSDGLSENVKFSSEDATLSVADRLLLSESFTEVLRLGSLGVEEWPWRVVEARHLATGDGAVLLWEQTPGAGVSAVTFPLSPSQLLLIGDHLPDRAPLNTLLAQNCRRWIVGEPGTLNLAQASMIAAKRRDTTQPNP